MCLFFLRIIYYVWESKVGFCTEVVWETFSSHGFSHWYLMALDAVETQLSLGLLIFLETREGADKALDEHGGSVICSNR